MGIFPKVWVENKTYFKPPPSLCMVFFLFFFAIRLWEDYLGSLQYSLQNLEPVYTWKNTFSSPASFQGSAVTNGNGGSKLSIPT